MKQLKFEFNGCQLTEEQSRTMISLMMHREKERPMTEEVEMIEDPAVQMILKRIKAFKLNIQFSNYFIAMMLTALERTSPGNIVMLLWYVNQIAKEYEKTYFDINEFGMTCFPYGLPSEDDFKKFWHSQKGKDQPLGNMLDNPKYW